MSEKEKTVGDILCEVVEQICDGYCKYPAEYNANGDDDRLYDEKCINCPLNRLL